MEHSKILQMIKDLSEERETLLAREDSHYPGASDHRRLEDVDHALGVCGLSGGGSWPASTWGWTKIFSTVTS
jgi:hypothetical protein